MKSRAYNMDLLSLKSVIISLILLFLLPTISFADNLKVTLITSSTTDAYTITADSIKTSLKNNRFNNVLIKTAAFMDMVSQI